MPTVRQSRKIAAQVEDLWAVVGDPHHLPRWWPRVIRVEDVEEHAFTEVMKTQKGKSVRADFDVVRVDDAEHLLIWAQRIEGTPFARVLKSSQIEVRLVPVPDAPSTRALGTDSEPVGARPATASEVTIELTQELAGFSPRFGVLGGMSPRLGGYMVRKAADSTIEEALDGLERIGG